MSKPRDNVLTDSRVCLVKTGTADYRGPTIDESLRQACGLMGWNDDKGRPLGNVIEDGDFVVLKPNLVMHRNQGPWGLDPLLTNAELIEATANAALQSDASRVLIGDAPLQSCDFNVLVQESGLRDRIERFARNDSRCEGIADFRRTACEFVAGVRMVDPGLKPLDQFVLFDLGENSLLEEISGDDSEFRVTCYNPDLLAKTHGKGTHQYLVAHQIIDAAVVVNMPKLKTHKKAGMTCALKNLIGINGNKEYLPHHRVGGSSAGGDCYPGSSKLKEALEYTLDKMNSAPSFAGAFLWGHVAGNLSRVLAASGDKLGVEGSWSGNDTIWRTCLDLNRILLYGRPDGTLADEPQRKVIHIVDAVIAGQGDGPLKPEPVPLSLLIAGTNAAAVDWVGAGLLGYDQNRVLCVKNAFNQFRWPLCRFSPNEIALLGDVGGSMESIRDYSSRFEIKHPAGWVDAAIETPSKAQEASHHMHAATGMRQL